MSANMVVMAIQILHIFNATLVVFISNFTTTHVITSTNMFSRSSSTTIVSNFRLLCTQLLNVYDDPAEHVHTIVDVMVINMYTM